MGQIRKRGSVYQIRYYRNGQRIEEIAGLHEARRSARSPAQAGRATISNGVPITAKSTRLTFDDAVKDVPSRLHRQRAKVEGRRRAAHQSAPDAGLRRPHAQQHHDGRPARVRRDSGSRPRRHAGGNQPRARDRAAGVSAGRAEADKYHGRCRKSRCCRSATSVTASSMTRWFEAVLAKLPAALQPVVHVRLRHRLARAERGPAARVAAR